MNGYFRPKLKNERKELHLLELEDCDFVTDDEVLMQPIFGRHHACPRCGEVSRITSKDPYCLGCNWDSLTDPIYKKQKCAA
jgi:hypothetical protein